MDRQSIHAALARLRAEHARNAYRDPQARARTEDLIAEMELQLQRTDDSGRREALRQRLAASVREFEAEHPQLTAALSQVVSLLSGMGI